MQLFRALTAMVLLLFASSALAGGVPSELYPGRASHVRRLESMGDARLSTQRAQSFSAMLSACAVSSVPTTIGAAGSCTLVLPGAIAGVFEGIGAGLGWLGGHTIDAENFSETRYFFSSCKDGTVASASFSYGETSRCRELYHSWNDAVTVANNRKAGTGQALSAQTDKALADVQAAVEHERERQVHLYNEALAHISK